PGMFHYVVVVGWGRGKVIVHDPARAPFRVLDEAAFDRVWQQSQRWMLVALPPARGAGTATAADTAAAAATTSRSPCDGLVDEGVRLANAGERAAARQALTAAGESCPRSVAAWRELAGLDALEGKWAEAESHAQRALREDPHDAH